MGKMNFSQHVLNVFANHQTTLEQMTQLMTDVALGRDIYDPASGKSITKAEANDKIYKFSCEIFGVDKNTKGKELRRALEDHGKEFLAIANELNEIYGLNVTKTLDASSFTRTEQAPKAKGFWQRLLR